MNGEREVQVGWLGPYGIVPGGMDVDPAPHWRPVYVKVPDPATLNRDDPHSRLLPNLERCPTCGSGRKEERFLGEWLHPGSDALVRCPDPWHSTPRPGE